MSGGGLDRWPAVKRDAWSPGYADLMRSVLAGPDIAGLLLRHVRAECVVIGAGLLGVVVVVEVIGDDGRSVIETRMKAVNGREWAAGGDRLGEVLGHA